MMHFSIFKSLITGAFLFASHASAEILNWDINFLQLLPNFSMDVTNEIALKYEIGTGRTSYEAIVFEKGCTVGIDSTTIKTTSSTTSKDSNHDYLEVLLDLDKQTIAQSNFWNRTSNNIELCVRVNLLSESSGVIKTDERDVNVEINFAVDFEADVNLAKNTINGVGIVEVSFTVNMTLIPDSGIATLAVDDANLNAVEIEILENAMQGIEPRGSSRLTKYGDVSLTRRMLRYLEEGTDVQYEIIFSEWCDGSNDCVSTAIKSADDFSSALVEGVGDGYGSFPKSINDIAIAEGIQNLQNVKADPVSLIFSEYSIRFIAFVNQTARVENYVEACLCDNASSFTCINTATLNTDSLLNVCIKSISGEMEIDSIDNLKMTQGTEELVIVKKNTLEDSSISSMTMVSTKNGVHVDSVIPSRFFSYDGVSAATITGSVYIKLSGSRRLAFEITGGSTYALTEAFSIKESTFAINIELEKNTDTNFGVTPDTVMSGFIVAIATAILM